MMMTMIYVYMHEQMDLMNVLKNGFYPIKTSPVCCWCIYKRRLCSAEYKRFDKHVLKIRNRAQSK